MRKIKIFKNVVFAAATTIIAATPLIITSCTRTVVKSQELDSIKIDLPDENYKVAVGKFISSSTPIDVVCLDKEGETIDVKTTFVLICDELKDTNWLWINQENKINIQGNVDPGIYHFHIYAQSRDKRIKSKTKSFVVDVYEAKEIPDEILIIEPEGEQLVFISQEGNIPLNIYASKPGYEEYQLNKECNWQITNIGDLPLDLDGRALFSIVEDEGYAKLVLSTRIDDSYAKTYLLSIKAMHKEDPSLTDDCLISIKVANGLYYKDEDEIYTRPSFDSDWELTRISSDKTVFQHVRETIYDIPVTKIGDYFCNNSGITKLSKAIIPPFITTIGDYAFYNQSYMTVLEMPGVTTVGNFAFYNCYYAGETTEDKQPNLVYIGDHGFYRCDNYRLNKLQDLVYLGNEGMEYMYMTDIHIGPKIKYMGYRCIAENNKLASITIDAATPPELAGALWGGTVRMTPKIAIPSSSLPIYRKTICWENYSDYFVGI